VTLNAKNAELASTRLYEAETSVADIAARYGLDAGSIIDFSLNVNPFGPPRKAIAAAQAALGSCNFYPDLNFAPLRKALAERHGIEEDMLFFGAGLDDVIKLLIHAWTSAGDAVLVHLPTFPRYALEAGLRGCQVIGVESPSPEKTDIGRIRAALTRQMAAMAFICTPNNPTGERFPEEVVLDLAKSFPATIFVVDEALINPAEDGMIALPKAQANVVVMRTFSKYFGLAGLRVGYAVADPRLIEVAAVGRPPFNMALPSVEAAVAALDDAAFLADCKTTFAAENTYFTTQVMALPGVAVRCGHGNMVLLDLQNMTAAEGAEALARQGVVVADATSFQGLENYNALRVSLRGRADNEKLVAALRNIV